METDPLQQLRDIQLPADPAWWPPAYGWWIIALAGGLLLAWLLREAFHAWRRRAPIRAARRLYAGLHQRLLAGEIDQQTYCHQCNELLKRLMVHGLGYHHLGPQVEDTWLKSLDQISGTQQFSNGPGQVLGNERFRRAPDIDVGGLHLAMAQVLKAAQP